MPSPLFDSNSNCVTMKDLHYLICLFLYIVFWIVHWIHLLLTAIGVLLLWKTYTLLLPFTLSLGLSTGSTSSWMQLELHCCEGLAFPWCLLLPFIIFLELILELSTSRASNNHTCDGCRKMKRLCNWLTWWWDVLKRLCNFDWHNGEVHCRWLRDAWFCWCYKWSWQWRMHRCCWTMM